MQAAEISVFIFISVYNAHLGLPSQWENSHQLLLPPALPDPHQPPATSAGIKDHLHFALSSSVVSQ
jgi:hypothetical protein